MKPNTNDRPAESRRCRRNRAGMQARDSHLHRGAGWFLLLAVIAVLTVLLVTSCGGSKAELESSKSPLPVRVASVASEVVSQPIRGTGLLALKDEVPLSFKIGGVVVQVSVEEGDRVEAGQILASLDLRGINARWSQTQSALEKARRDLDRARRLYADSVATLEQVQDAETALTISRAAFDAVEFDRLHAIITAPSDGVILRRTAEPGEVISPGRPVLVFGGTARGTVVRVGLADRDAVRLRRGDRATVLLQIDRQKRVEGVVTEIAAAADPATGTFAVEIAIPEVSRLVTGLVANVEIHPAGTEEVALIPVEVLVEADGEKGVVFTLDESRSRAERREVEIAFLHDRQVAVRSGLSGVREVIRDGAVRLDDGDEVVVIP